MPIVEEDHGPLGNIVAALGDTPEGISGGSSAVISLAQQKVGSAADGSAPFTVTFNTPVTAGNSVLVQIAFDPTKALFIVPPTMTGGGAGTLTQGIANETVNNIWLYNYYIHVLNGETGVTFTLDTAVPLAAYISEWQGLANAGPTNTDFAAVNDATPGFSTFASASNSVSIVSYATVNNVYSSGPTSGFTRMTPANVAGIYLESAYLIGTGPQPTWTLTGAEDWSTVGCVFGH